MSRGVTDFPAAEAAVPSRRPERARRRKGPLFGFQIAVFVAVYYAAARLGFSLAYIADQVTVVWAPSGLAIALIAYFGARVWPAVFAGAFLANVTTAMPLWTALAIAAGNTLEAVSAVWMLDRLPNFSWRLRRTHDAASFIVLAAVVSPVLSATIGTLALAAAGLQPWSNFINVWAVWWLGDALGAMVAAPAVMTFSRAALRAFRRHPTQAALLAASIVVLVTVIFNYGGNVRFGGMQYLIFPLLIWAALRFGTSGAALASLLVAVLTVWQTSRGVGPFASGAPGDDLVLLQLFMATLSSTSLLLAAAITDNREQQAMLRAGEKRYRSLVLATSQVVWHTTAAGQVIEDLPTWSEFTGQPSAEALGRGWLAMVHPEDVPGVVARWEESLQNRLPHENEFRVRVVGGSYRYVYARAVPVHNDNGEIREWVGTLTDVTERKLLENKRAELLEVEQQLNRRKDDFLAMLAHELRNPLAPILTAAAVLENRNGDSMSDRALAIIKRQAQHLTRIVDDLLDVARITRGTIEVRTEVLDLGEIALSVSNDLKPFFAARQQQFTCDLPGKPVLVRGDRTRLDQVVTNLLQNASKYTADGGRIELRLEAAGDQAVLRVRDDGRGIAKHFLPHIFDLFTQEDRSLDRSRGGLGLGLNIVRNIVELHRGQVSAHSDGEGAGAEFTVVLPLTIDERPNFARSAPEGAPSLRIMIVEDNADAAETLAALLSLEGHVVRVFHDAYAALDAASSFVPQIILLDLGLPGMDGYQAAPRLRAAYGDTPLKIVALSGYGQAGDRLRSTAAGFDHHLVKPANVDALLELLGELHASLRAANPTR